MSARYPEKTIIGLTGNIAVGKSRVMAMLADLGAATIDADEVAHGVLLREGGAYKAVVAAFGVGHSGRAKATINRRALGAIVFNDDAALKRLEAITHPVIRSEIDRRVRAAEAVVVVIEAIKLLEGGLKDVVDAVWVVNASEERQLARLMAGRGLPADEAARRIALQNSQADKLRQADVVIENDGDLAATRAQVERAWADLATEPQRHRGK